MVGIGEVRSRTPECKYGMRETGKEGAGSWERRGSGGVPDAIMTNGMQLALDRRPGIHWHEPIIGLQTQFLFPTRSYANEYTVEAEVWLNSKDVNGR